MATWQAAVTLSVFLATVAVVIFLVLRPQRWTVQGRTVHFSYCWAPVVGCLLLLSAQCMSGQDLLRGLKGTGSKEPYGILILFMALAYLAASLDATGVFVWMALHITRLSKGRGHVLFLLYYLTSAAVTALTNNDVSIMTLTPIVVYFARATKCDPMPYLTAELMAANIWSALLFVGNPTNIIAAQAFGLTFIGYTQFMALPTIAAGILCPLHLYLSVRHRLPDTLELPEVHPSAMLTDRVGAVFGCVNMLVCLVLLALAPTIHWNMWLITLVCALVNAVYNAIAMLALDPVSGRWLGWAAMIDRMQTEAQQGKADTQGTSSAVVPYTASGPDERAADAILQQAAGHTTTPPPSQPTPAPSSRWHILAWLRHYGSRSRSAPGACHGSTVTTSAQACASMARASTRATAKEADTHAPVAGSAPCSVPLPDAGCVHVVSVGVADGDLSQPQQGRGSGSGWVQNPLHAVSAASADAPCARAAPHLVIAAHQERGAVVDSDVLASVQIGSHRQSSDAHGTLDTAQTAQYQAHDRASSGQHASTSNQGTMHTHTHTHPPPMAGALAHGSSAALLSSADASQCSTPLATHDHDPRSSGPIHAKLGPTLVPVAPGSDASGAWIERKRLLGENDTRMSTELARQSHTSQAIPNPLYVDSHTPAQGGMCDVPHGAAVHVGGCGIHVAAGQGEAGANRTVNGYRMQAREGGEGGVHDRGSDGCVVGQVQGEGGSGWVEELAPPPRSFLRTFTCLPWEVVPFVLGMFVLVEALKVQGWITHLAEGLGKVCGAGGLGPTVLLMGVVSVAMSNVINNQAQTILLTTVCLQPAFIDALARGLGLPPLPPEAAAGAAGVPVPPAVVSLQRGALFAVVVGSNIGALFTLIGALAGIMWANILRGMRITVTYSSFFRLMTPLGITGTVAFLLVLWANLLIQ